MRYSFHPEAEVEFYEAINYYKRRQQYLGYDFAIEVYATIQNIIDYPNAWTILEGDIRRCQTKRFPYGIVYNDEGGGIFILAVMHLHRDPDYWKDRVL